MELSQKYIKRLANRQWFHATDEEGLQNILKTGVLSDYNKGSELDFGFGFYLSPSLEEAQNYINRLYHAVSNDDEAIIIEFDFHPLTYFRNEAYNTYIFPHFNDEFAKFVFKNRWHARTTSSNLYQQQHTYDIIYGCMSDGNPTNLLLQYENGEISYSDVIEGLKKDNHAKQLSIHNQEICNTLIITHIYQYCPKTQLLKEVLYHE